MHKFNKIIKESTPKEDKFSGNCGMYAIALAKRALDNNKTPVIVVCSDTHNDLDALMYGEPKIYHIAVEIDGELYDDRGKINENILAQFAYDVYGDSNPALSFLEFNDAVITMIRQQTNWDTSWQEYYDDMNSKANNEANSSHQLNKIIKESIDNLELPPTFKPDFGSCMLAAEILTRKLLSMGRTDFMVIEGYITFSTVEWSEQHTWIEMHNGEIIDPTKTQWGIKNIIYLSKKRKEYTPQQYMSLCEKYPDKSNYPKYLGNYKYLGTCTDLNIWDATEMAQIVENSQSFDIEGIYLFLPDDLKQKVKDGIIDAGINGDIVWVYDTIEDIHYFYRKSLSE